jgi:hypothetical protein
MASPIRIEVLPVKLVAHHVGIINHFADKVKAHPFPQREGIATRRLQSFSIHMTEDA